MTKNSNKRRCPHCGEELASAFVSLGVTARQLVFLKESGEPISRYIKKAIMAFNIEEHDTLPVAYPVIMSVPVNLGTTADKLLIITKHYQVSYQKALRGIIELSLLSSF